MFISQYQNSLLPATSGDHPTIPIVLIGTASSYDVDRVAQWRQQLQPRLRFRLDVVTKPQEEVSRPDVRSAIDHINNIRQTLNPTIPDLASIFEVSRQAVYKWISGKSTPEEDKFDKLRALSQIADKFRAGNITRASFLIKLKTFNGQSLIDLIISGENCDEHIEVLINEDKAMMASYEKSGLSTSKAEKTSDWQSSISIPGASESL